MRNLLIIALSGLLVWFGQTIVRLENERYINDLGMCPAFDATRPVSLMERRECLDNTETRTSAWWHLAYGLGIY